MTRMEPVGAFGEGRIVSGWSDHERRVRDYALGLALSEQRALFPRITDENFDAAEAYFEARYRAHLGAALREDD